MVQILAAEHLSLTAFTREWIEEELEKLQELLPDSAQIRIFLSQDGKHHFKALLKLKIKRQMIVAKTGAYELRDAIHESFMLIRKRAMQLRKAHLSKRRHPRHLSERRATLSAV